MPLEETQIDIFSIKLPAYIEAIKDQYNTLTIVIQEATGLGPEEDDPTLGFSIGPSREIIPCDSDRLLEISWSDYVGYSVLNESFANVEEKNLHPERKYKFAVEKLDQGYFKEYMKDAAFADNEFPGPLQYWEVVGSDHVVHVLSHVEPQIRLLKPAQPTTKH